MPVSSVLGRSALVAATLLAPLASAHDSALFKRHRQAPFAGPLVLNKTQNATAAFESNGVTLLGWVPLSAFGGVQTTGADCWGYTSPAGTEIAIIGLQSGVGFVDVTDPGLPVVIETLPAVSSDWRDIKVYQDHAYYCSEGGDGIQIVDLSQVDQGTVSLVGSVNSAGTSASHNIAIDTDSGFLYQTGGGDVPVEGLRIYSLANPASPTFVGEWDDRYVHDAQVVTYTSGPWAGRQIAFCFSESGAGGGSPGVDILDVTNKNSIQTLSTLTYSSPVFSHQGWLSPDRQHLYINDELDELTFGGTTLTRVIDVSDLTDPVQVGTFSSGTTSVDHNLYTEGSLIYEANYRSGLRVFDASDPTAPVQTAWFDTYEADDAAAFNGLWSVFPYFDSSTIIGSDIEKGLFVWRLGPPELSFDLAEVPELVSPFGDSLFVDVSAVPGQTVDANTVTLHLDTGSGFTSQPLVALGGDSFRADLPSLACGATVRWYLSAQTVEGTTWVEPAGAPTAVYQAVAANAVVVDLMEDLEGNAGWTVGSPGDDATTGIWTRVDPIGTAAQPEDDHTPGPGTDCYVTGQGVFGGGLGDDDVDGGRTTLRTAVFDASQGDPTISYWRWYSNNTGGSPAADVFEVDISNTGGGNWVSVEEVGPGGPETIGGWFQHSFRVADVITPTATMQLRFRASDEGDGSIVEAAVDDLELVRYDCSVVCQTDLGFGGPGNALLQLCGEPLDSGNTAQLTLTQAPPSTLAVLFLGFANTPVPFKGGQLVPFPIALNLSLLTDGSGSLGFPIPGGGGPLTVYAQFALADGAQVSGVGLSNALEVQFGP